MLPSEKALISLRWKQEQPLAIFAEKKTINV